MSEDDAAFELLEAPLCSAEVPVFLRTEGDSAGAVAFATAAARAGDGYFDAFPLLRSMLLPFAPGHKRWFGALVALLVLGLASTALHCFLDRGVDRRWHAFLTLGGLLYPADLVLCVALRHFCHHPTAPMHLHSLVVSVGWSQYYARGTGVWLGLCWVAYVGNIVLHVATLLRDLSSGTTGGFLYLLYWALSAVLLSLTYPLLGTLVWLFLLTARNLKHLVAQFVEGVRVGVAAQSAEALLARHRLLQAGLEEASQVWQLPVAMALIALVVCFSFELIDTLLNPSGPAYWAAVLMIGSFVVLLVIVSVLVDVNAASQPLPQCIVHQVRFGPPAERVALAHFFQSHESGQLHFRVFGVAITRAFLIGIGTTGITPMLVTVLRQFLAG